MHSDRPEARGIVADDGSAVRIDNLSVHFPIRGGLLGHSRVIRAVDGVTLSLSPGETLGIVGESGSGKSTLGFATMGRYRPTAGRILVHGEDISRYSRSQLRLVRRDLQMIYQDPYGSLNPRMRIEDIVAEPLVAHGIVTTPSERRARVGELLELCGMPANVANRYPGAFSGGQRQRIVIARAVALKPKVVIADEPTSALDVSVQAQILTLMRDLQRELNLSYLFISHDLGVVRQLCHRVAVMYQGKLVEQGAADDIFTAPTHAYTQALLAAIPSAVRTGDSRQ